MIVIKLELWPGGDPNRARDLGSATIHNVTNLADDSAYEVRLLKGEHYAGKNAGKLYRRGRVESFPRRDKRFGPWELLALALEATVGDRIERLKMILRERK